MEFAVKTHIGHIREVNEDCAEVLMKDQSTALAIVADGMGGHQAGEVASQLTIQRLREAFEAVGEQKDAAKWEEWLLASIEDANQFIYQHALTNQAYLGMGTTIAAILLLDDYYIAAHVGDSRIYRFADGKLLTVTEDHSLVNELLRSGQITKEEAEYHPQRNVITRALGTEESVEVEIKTLSYEGDEQFILCSDGLSDRVTEAQVVKVLQESISLEQKADRLIQLALDAGGDDNISIILLQTKKDIERK